MLCFTVPAESSRTAGVAPDDVAPSKPVPGRSAGSFLKRFVSWAALWGLAIVAIYYASPLLVFLLIAAFGLAGQWEFYSAQEEKGQTVFKNSGLACGALLYLTSWYFLIQNPVHAPSVTAAEELVLVLIILGVFIRLVLQPRQEPAPIATAALTILGIMYVPFLFNFVVFIAFMPGNTGFDRFLLIYLFAVTKFSDVGAYVIGSLVGRHKMIPRVSPGKTWEGFAGGVLIALLLSMGLVRWCSAGRLSFSSSIVLGLLLPLVSVLGDLAESMIKRDAAIKDSGRTIPGIGGALDLIDSILFTAPILYFFVQFTAR
jgi:phosphatidate cytidylyltransferase